MEIVEIKGLFLDKAKEFLESVESLKTIDLDVLNEGVALVDLDEIIGVISYEKFKKYGLIRYFVFKRKIVDEYILDIFNKISELAIKRDVKYLFLLVSNGDVYDLFKELGFTQFDSSNLFIEEDNISKTKYENSIVMIKEIGGSFC